MPDDTTGLGFKRMSFHLGKKKFISIPDKMIEDLEEEYTFPYPIPLDVYDMLHDHVEKNPKVNNAERNRDSDDTPSVMEMTYERLHTMQKLV